MPNFGQGNNPRAAEQPEAGLSLAESPNPEFGRLSIHTNFGSHCELLREGRLHKILDQIDGNGLNAESARDLLKALGEAETEEELYSALEELKKRGLIEDADEMKRILEEGGKEELLKAIATTLRDKLYLLSLLDSPEPEEPAATSSFEYIQVDSGYNPLDSTREKLDVIIDIREKQKFESIFEAYARAQREVGAATEKEEEADLQEQNIRTADVADLQQRDYRVDRIEAQYGVDLDGDESLFHDRNFAIDRTLAELREEAERVRKRTAA